MSEVAVPVLCRLTALRELWVAFSRDPEARVLCWALDANESRLALGFVRVEGAEGGETTTLFFPVEEAVEDVDALWEALPVAIAEAWGEMSSSLMSVGRPLQWELPVREDREASLAYAVRVCASLGQLPSAPWEHVAIALLSRDPSPHDVWARLVQELLSTPMPESVRWLLCCAPEDPVIAALDLQKHPTLRRDRPELDLLGMVEEIIADQPVREPGDEVRQGLTRLLGALSKADAAQADAAYAQAMAVVRREDWSALAVGLEMAYSQSMQQRGASERAMQHLESAFAAAQRATGAGDPQGLRLEAQSLLAIGSAQAVAGGFEQAAQSFAAAGLRGNTLQDPFLMLESWRQASDFAARAGDTELSWALGAQAMQALSLMGSEAMGASTLGLLVEHMRSLAPQRSVAERDAIEVVAGLLSTSGVGAR